jgi:AraC-like DNA-binding protein
MGPSMSVMRGSSPTAFAPAMTPQRGARFHVVKPARFPGLELHEGRGVVDRFDAHDHADYDVVLIEAGGRRLAQRGEELSLGPGELYVTSSGERHGGISAEEGWSFRSLYVPPQLFAEAADEAGGRRRGASPFEPRAAAATLRDPALAERFRAACAALGRPLATLEQQSRLLGVLVEMVRPGAARPPARQGVREPRAVAQVEEYLREHATEDVSLDELAALTQLSKFHLLRAFRAHRGVTPHAQLRRYRIAMARALLWHGTSPSDVAIRTGFYDQSHLTNAFRDATGMTPARFQRLRPSGAPAASAGGATPGPGSP